MIVERIFAHARSSPDRTAVITNGRPLSYLRFAGRICAVRGFLENQPVSPERVAVLCIHNIVDGWIIGLALRSLGVTTVHGRSLEDIKALELKEASLVSTTREIGTWSGLESLAAATGQPVITLPSDLLDDSAQPRIEGAATIGGAGFGGHIMLTSGTTGAFKKVLIDPRVEDTIIKARGALFGLTSASRVCLFDYGGWTVVGYHRPLSVWDAGAATIFHQGPERWRALAVPGVTIVHANEYYLTSVLEAPPEVSLRNDAMTLISGAGVLSSSHWRRARERLTNDVRATYGSTEAGLCGFTRIETADDLNWHHILPGYQVQVVDEADRPLPAGEVGIVRVLTNDVTGYLDDEAATRAFFRGGFFYPGDLGVLRGDGRLSLHGRVTDVINVRGLKIATTPIETALRESLDAEAVCLFSVPGADGEEVHVAVHPRRSVPMTELRTALATALKSFAIDQVEVHTVPAFPRNHMGKIDRAALKRQLLPPKDAIP